MTQSRAGPPCRTPQIRPTARGVAGVVAREVDRIQVPDRDAIANRDSAGAIAGNAGEQEQDVEVFAVGLDANLAVAGAGETGKAVDAAEHERGKVCAPEWRRQNEMRTRRHDPSEDLTEGMGKEPTATSATDARRRCRV